jgi:hypothetical protein
MVSRALADSVAEHNKVIYARIEKKYGRNWHKKYRADIEKEIARIKKATAILDKQERVINKRAELKKTNNDLYYYFKVKRFGEYEAKVTGMGYLKREKEYLSYFVYAVNIDKSTAKLLSDTVKKF